MYLIFIPSHPGGCTIMMTFAHSTPGKNVGTRHYVSITLSGKVPVASSTMGRRCIMRICLSLMLMLIFASGYMYFFEKQKWQVERLMLLQGQLGDKETSRPVNNLTYPVFRHPLAPPYPYPYKFLINQEDKCKGRNPFLVLLVIGATRDLETRHAIRETWGNDSNYDVDVVTIFLLGLSNIATDRFQQMLEEESEAFGDIVQQDFMDTYYNLTLKSLMGMEWVAKFCPTASYVVKIDNDMFLNVDYLVHQLLRPELPVRTNYFTGYIVINTGPLRGEKYKWYVPKEIYPNDTYPPYASGPGYVFSADMAKKIYDISQQIRVIPMEDSFMGICLFELKIRPTVPPGNIFNGHRIDYDRCRFNKLVTVHHYGSAELRTVWTDFWTKKSSGC
ncbi:PREDICTED: beta-1,3-galactosyltransferase 1-like [Nanorana parkeri]|uniref:beta-1,3-galactosyltransferase 1-like n=1 Tax=Nanorana parkeri TaxID=125878 RepID=UPI000854324A|nr:PREDICTED: beta-1,3-galactosyltransferase 1-like [Nanorana parkeri]